MKYYFYKKEKKEIKPVEEEALNLEAKEKIEQLLKEPEKHNIPSWILRCDHVALFQSKGNLKKANAPEWLCRRPGGGFSPARSGPR